MTENPTTHDNTARTVPGGASAGRDGLDGIKLSLADLAGVPEGTSLKIVQRRSAIGAKPKNRGTLRALGLRKIGTARAHKASPQLTGMLRKVNHLVDIVRIDERGDVS
jgi:large subunit ribosomal protein L30